MANANSTGYRGIGHLPLGAAVLAILIGIVGIVVLLGGVLLLLFGTSVAFGNGGVTILGSNAAISGLVLFVVGLLTVAVAGGLWNQELWALALAVIVLAFYALVEIAAQAWLGFLVVALLLVYLVAVSGHFD